MVVIVDAQAANEVLGSDEVWTRTFGMHNTMLHT